MASKEKNKDFKKKGVSKGTHARSGAASSAKPKKNERTGGLLGMAAGTGTEKKYVDTQIASGIIGTLATPAVPLLVNGVAQGTDANTRIGRKVSWDSILVRLRLVPNTTTPTNDSYRIMLVVDKQANAQAATAAQITETTAFTSPNNMGNRARFVTLWDKKGVVTTGGDNGVVLEELYLRKKFQTIFNGTDATIGSITSGALYLLLFGAVSLAPSAQGYVRLRFTDD